MSAASPFLFVEKRRATVHILVKPVALSLLWSRHRAVSKLTVSEPWGSRERETNNYDEQKNDTPP